MASMAQVALYFRWAPHKLSPQIRSNNTSKFPHQFLCCGKVSPFIYGHVCKSRSFSSPTFTCSASNKPSNSSNDISSTAKIRSEVLSPFRSLRMFFYLAFMASGGLGGLIALTQLIGALANPSRAPEVPEIAKGLGIDVAAVSVFAFLYSRDNKASNAQIARLSREETLANLKVRVVNGKTIPISSLRGIARVVILAGPSSFISESFKLSEPFTRGFWIEGCLWFHLLLMESFPVLSLMRVKI
ncbi:Protein LOW PSII ACCUMULATION 1 chloroplastic [Bienertia sinuspersici]